MLLFGHSMFTEPRGTVPVAHGVVILQAQSALGCAPFPETH